MSLIPSTLRRILHQLGLRWKRPRLAMPRKNDPEKAAKQWQLAKAVVEAVEGTAILYADESRIQLLPLLRAMWGWIGQQLRVPTPGNNETRMLFGALNIRTGNGLSANWLGVKLSEYCAPPIVFQGIAFFQC